MIHFDNTKISHIACNIVVPLSARDKTGDLAQVHIIDSMAQLSETLEVTKFFC